MFARIIALFRKTPAPSAPAPTPEPHRTTGDARGPERSERGPIRDSRRGGRNSGSRRSEETDERIGERQERPGSRNERVAEKNPREETSAGGERQERRPRAERKERVPRQQPEAVDNRPVQPAAVAGVAAGSLPPDTNAAREGAGTTEEQASRRRGRRGGRGRGERRNEPDGAVASGIPEATPDVISTLGEEPVVVVIPPVESKHMSVAETPAVLAPVEALPAFSEPAPLAIEPAPAAAKPVPVSLPGEIAVPEAVAVDVAAVDIPKSSEITPLPAPAVAEPTVNLEEALSESGLVLVQTTVPAAVVPSEPPPRLGRPRKHQAHAATADEAPLVMVETAK